MGGSVVKTVVLLLLLVVFSAIIGSQFSGSLAESYGAFYIVGALVAFGGMIYVGERCWLLVFVLPVMLMDAPIGVKLPLVYVPSVAILVGALVMYLLRQVKFYWHTLWVADLSILLLFVLLVVSFIRYPVTVNVLGIDYDYVGGQDYIWYLCATLHYIAISALTPRKADIPKVVKWSMLLMLLMQVPYMLVHGSHRGFSSLDERFAYLYLTGSTLLFFAYAKLPLIKLFSSMRNTRMLVVGAAMVLFTGGRESLLRAGVAMGFLSFLKRELTAAVLLAGALYGFLFYLGSERVLEKAPYGIQRILTLLPGIQVSGDIQASTKGSSNTRLMIWKMGLDPRTGLIQDYICGDGFRTSVQEMQRSSIAAMRGTADLGFASSSQAWAYQLAKVGNWHNGWMSTLKNLGVVGVVAVNVYFLCGLLLMVKVSSAYRGSKEYPYLMAMCLPFAAIAFSFVIGTQTLRTVSWTVIQLGYIKMLYCAAREQGRISPLFLRAPYVPLAIREQESSAEQAH